MKTFEYKDQWGDVTRVRLVRGAYADGSLAVQMLCEGDGYWEPYATLTVNLCDARSQNASFAYVDTNNMPAAEGPRGGAPCADRGPAGSESRSPGAASA